MVSGAYAQSEYGLGSNKSPQFDLERSYAQKSAGAFTHNAIEILGSALQCSALIQLIETCASLGSFRRVVRGQSRVVPLPCCLECEVDLADCHLSQRRIVNPFCEQAESRALFAQA